MKPSHSPSSVLNTPSITSSGVWKVFAFGKPGVWLQISRGARIDLIASRSPAAAPE